MGDAALGAVTAHNYSAAHPSQMNRHSSKAFKAANGGRRPNFVGVHTYDGMHLVYAALEKTGGETDGDKLIEAMKGMAGKARAGRSRSIRKPATSSRTSTSARSRRGDDGELYNVEFATFENVKDPVKAAK